MEPSWVGRDELEYREDQGVALGVSRRARAAQIGGALGRDTVYEVAIQMLVSLATTRRSKNVLFDEPYSARRQFGAPRLFLPARLQLPSCFPSLLLLSCSKLVTRTPSYRTTPLIPPSVFSPRLNL